MTTALICGVTGQDGAYLADLLVGQGCRVVGTSRDPARADLSRLGRLGIDHLVELVAFDPADAEQARDLVARVAPDEIYNLAGQSSVGRSFAEPAATFESHVNGLLHLLEAVRTERPHARLLNAGSGEMFGELDGRPADEDSPLSPLSPYGAAKASAFLLVRSYRDAFDLHAATAILFNHESPLRTEQFVTRKITRAAARIAGGSEERLRLGAVGLYRDWGWSPDYVEAMVRMARQEAPEDLILATGRSVPISAFVASAFAACGLDWRDHVDHDPALERRREIGWSGGNPARAAERLGWRAEVGVEEVARRMVAAERGSLAGGALDPASAHG